MFHKFYGFTLFAECRSGVGRVSAECRLSFRKTMQIYDEEFRFCKFFSKKMQKNFPKRTKSYKSYKSYT